MSVSFLEINDYLLKCERQYEKKSRDNTYSENPFILLSVQKHKIFMF